jgi:hypothetical protein
MVITKPYARREGERVIAGFDYGGEKTVTLDRAAGVADPT